LGGHCVGGRGFFKGLKCWYWVGFVKKGLDWGWGWVGLWFG